MTDPTPYRRRRLLVGLAAVVVVAIVAGLFLARRGSDDKERAVPTTVALPPQLAVDVIDQFHKAPCSLIAAAEVLQATQRQAHVVGGGPAVLCTYGLDGTPKDDVVTAQVIGPQSNRQYEALTAGGVSVAGKPVAQWLDGGGTGGRLLAHKGSVTVEIGVRLAKIDKVTLQQIGRELLDHALTRIPANTATSGKTSDEDCALVSTQAIGALLGSDTEALPQINTAACSFRAGSQFVSVERITGPLPSLDDIKRTTGGADGKQTEWARHELDLIDGGVYLADPDASHLEGELYFRQKQVLFHVIVVGVKDPEGSARRIALLLLS